VVNGILYLARAAASNFLSRALFVVADFDSGPFEDDHVIARIQTHRDGGILGQVARLAGGPGGAKKESGANITRLRLRAWWICFSQWAFCSLRN